MNIKLSIILVMMFLISACGDEYSDTKKKVEKSHLFQYKIASECILTAYQDNKKVPFHKAQCKALYDYQKDFCQVFIYEGFNCHEDFSPLEMYDLAMYYAAEKIRQKNIKDKG